MGRKSLTTIQGLKKETRTSQVIQLQGDQRKNVSTFLVQAGVVKKDHIKIHEQHMEHET
ncbi:Protein translation factor SUI1-like protein 2, partial [Bienertia sinuspersici]